MPITPKQRERRKNHLGASDMAAVLGLDRYRTAWDVWADKTGKLDEGDQPSDAMALGTALEDGILDFAAGAVGPIRRNQYRSHPSLPIGANLDAIVVAKPEIVEAKTAGLLGPTPDLWGEAGSDHIPERVIVQVHTQVLAMVPVVVDVAHVAVLIGGRGLLLFHLQPNRSILDAIAEAAERFWTKNVQGDVPPVGGPSLAVAKLLKRTPGKVTEVDPLVVADWLTACEAYQTARELRDEKAAEVLAAMGDAEAAVCGDQGAVTNYEQTRREYTVKASTFRVLRHKPKGLPT